MKRKMKTKAGRRLHSQGLAIALLVLAFARPGHAALSLTFTGSDAGGHSARADFSVSGTTLIIDLKNTATATSVAPADVLTAIFFNIQGTPTLTFSSAAVASGSTLINSDTRTAVSSPPTDLRLSSTPGGWDFNTTATGTYPQNYGLGAAGLNRFAGGTSSGGPGGPGNYGVIQSGYTSASGNLGNQSTPLVQNMIEFNLAGLPAGFTLSSTSITNVTFQYGTSTSDPSFNGTLQSAPVPEPSTIVGAGMAGLFGVGYHWRRRRRVSP